jgi:hypothetical protein
VNEKEKPSAKIFLYKRFPVRRARDDPSRKGGQETKDSEVNQKLPNSHYTLKKKIRRRKRMLKFSFKSA